MNKKNVKQIKFSSKSDVLKNLQKKITKAKIEKIFDFTVLEWKNNQENIIHKIKREFDSKIIVRSSAIGEDSINQSLAGSFKSILNVNSKSENQIKNAINQVINSYEKKENFFLKNKILIQKQTTKVICSGVIFTKIPESGSPYYVINFEEGSHTDTVTKGISNNVIKLFRKIQSQKIPIKWKKLMLAVIEIEKIFFNEPLDIEFGIRDSNEIIIFQVRPLTITKKLNDVKVEQKIQLRINEMKRKFQKLTEKNNIEGKYTVFSDMSDWNPSEIIGDNPNFLDYSLYDYLIMKNAWHKGRSVLGYNEIEDYGLMEKFGNKPYVDLRGSFYSLIPKEIPKKIKNKLFNFYFKKILVNPHFQDKIEFEILFTCYDSTTKGRLEELKKQGFTNSEIKIIENSLLNFTNNIINTFPELNKKCDIALEKLKLEREINLKKDIQENNHEKIIQTIEKLLKSCMDFGTINFSMMARIAFISSSIFKSLEKKEIIKFQDVENFMNSIITPLSEIQNDIYQLSKKKISKKSFLQKYGHLRPGTYDITAGRYDENDEIISNINFKIQKKKNIRLNPKILAYLKNDGLDFSIVEFGYFLRKALEQREKLKFEFTKNLSEVLELIIRLGKILDITRDDLAYLEIEDIIKCKKLNKENTKIKLNNIIKKNKKKKELNDLLIFPPIISSKEDFEVIRYYESEPNYISNKKIISNILSLDKKEFKSESIKNKIILIENADPGFDWIFTQNPMALITKYGGVASHMAIRCAEIGLPAAIGSGEIIYEKLLHSTKVMLDCKNKQILILENEKKDVFIEERKVLKSLGYIK